jgi:hypothetical protein
MPPYLVSDIPFGCRLFSGVNVALLGFRHICLDGTLLGVSTSPYLMSDIPFGHRLLSGVNAASIWCQTYLFRRCLAWGVNVVTWYQTYLFGRRPTWGANAALLGVRHTVWTPPFVGCQRPPLLDARHILFGHRLLSGVNIALLDVRNTVWMSPFVGCQRRYLVPDIPCLDIAFCRVSTPLLGDRHTLFRHRLLLGINAAFTWCQTYLV